MQQKALLSNDPEDLARTHRLASHSNVPADWQQRAAGLEPMASFRVQIQYDGALKRFFSVNSTVNPQGPIFGSEPPLTINALYPEDEDLDLSPLLEGELSHPLLFY